MVMFVLQFLYEQHFTHYTRLGGCCCMYIWICVSKERWGKLDLGYILDESYDHTKLPKSHVVKFFKATYPVFVVPSANAFWLSVPGGEMFVLYHFVITHMRPCHPVVEVELLASAAL
jgi:hypothetical protein